MGSDEVSGNVDHGLGIWIFNFEGDLDQINFKKVLLTLQDKEVPQQI